MVKRRPRHLRRQLPQLHPARAGIHQAASAQGHGDRDLGRRTPRLQLPGRRLRPRPRARLDVHHREPGATARVHPHPAARRTGPRPRVRPPSADQRRHRRRRPPGRLLPRLGHPRPARRPVLDADRLPADPARSRRPGDDDRRLVRHVPAVHADGLPAAARRRPDRPAAGRRVAPHQPGPLPARVRRRPRLVRRTSCTAGRRRHPTKAPRIRAEIMGGVGWRELPRGRRRPTSSAGTSSPAARLATGEPPDIRPRPLHLRPGRSHPRRRRHQHDHVRPARQPRARAAPRRPHLHHPAADRANRGHRPGRRGTVRRVLAPAHRLLRPPVRRRREGRSRSTSPTVSSGWPMRPRTRSASPSTCGRPRTVSRQATGSGSRSQAAPTPATLATSDQASPWRPRRPCSRSGSPSITTRPAPPPSSSP